jgi:2-oxoglutarate dehydrogenase E2 component (dihydrolipoamide succinyltransferase)
MAIQVVVPPMGESIQEATIARWLKQKGEAVKLDEVLLELETDKVTLEVNAPSAGVLQDVSVNTGGTVKVGQVVAVIDETAKGAAAPAVAQQKEAPANNAAASSSSASAAPLFSPAAQKIAQESGVSASAVSASGKDGRITKGDVLSALEGGRASAAAPAARVEERVRMTKLRQRIAQRLKESQNVNATLTTFNDVDMSAIMALRNRYKDDFEKKFGVKLGFMSLFTRAAVAALKEIPEVNAHIEGDEIIYKKYCDIGIAVGTPQGLVVPVVRDADRKSIAQIESDIADLAKKARDGKLAMEDMMGGTFTITNGGVYGSLLATPIINPPQSAILGMHRVEERPVARDGQVVVRPMMYIALSYDHRIIDGRESVTFLKRVKENIEAPERLLLDL